MAILLQHTSPLPSPCLPEAPSNGCTHDTGSMTAPTVKIPKGRHVTPPTVTAK